jgi:hypothetical protein
MGWTDLKAAVAAVIKTNGNQEITGALLQSTLNSIIDQMGTNHQFIGIATPATVPGTPDGNVFYIATDIGVYANFSGLEIIENEVSLLLWNGSWRKIALDIPTKAGIDELSQQIDEAITEEENARKNEDDRRFTVCNLDVIIPLPSGFYTLQTAIEAATGSTALSGRITPGFELRFKTSASVVHSFIYNGGDKYDTLSWKSNIVDIEKTARIAGDNALQESIDNLSGEIGSESLARTAGDNALQASIDNLSGEIGSESLARTAGDNALQQQIDSLDTAMGDISSALDEILLIGGSI